MSETVPTTTVLAAVKRYLLNTIDAPDFTVTWAAPAMQDQACVYFPDAHVDYEPRTLQDGRQVRNEIIDLTCVVMSGIPGDRMAEAEERALAIWAAVEDVIVSQAIVVEVDGVTGAWVSSLDSAAEPDVEGYSGQVVAKLHIESRIN